jgi:uncharacterized protein YndB with AHSA1/START domain
MPALRSVTRSVTVPTPPGRAWDAVTEPALVSRWMGLEVAFDVRPAGTGSASGPLGRRRIVVEVVNPCRRLVFSWWPEDGTGDAHSPSQVEITLQPADEGTRVTVTETALDDLAPVPHAVSDVMQEAAGR